MVTVAVSAWGNGGARVDRVSSVCGLLAAFASAQLLGPNQFPAVVFWDCIVSFPSWLALDQFKSNQSLGNMGEG
jgi:hypothetical protein